MSFVYVLGCVVSVCVRVCVCVCVCVCVFVFSLYMCVVTCMNVPL